MASYFPNQRLSFFRTCQVRFPEFSSTYFPNLSTLVFRIYSSQLPAPSALATFPHPVQLRKRDEVDIRPPRIFAPRRGRDGKLREEIEVGGVITLDDIPLALKVLDLKRLVKALAVLALAHQHGLALGVCSEHVDVRLLVEPGVRAPPRPNQHGQHRQPSRASPAHKPLGAHALELVAQVVVQALAHDSRGHDLAKPLLDLRRPRHDEVEPEVVARYPPIHELIRRGCHPSQIKIEAHGLQRLVEGREAT